MILQLITNNLFFLISFLISSPITILDFIIIYKYIKTRQKILGYLLSLLTLYLISGFFLLLQYFTLYQERAIAYFTISEISKLVFMYVLLLLFEMFYRNTQFSRRQTLITILIFMIIGGLLSEPPLEIYTDLGGFVIDVKFFSFIKMMEIVFTGFATIFLLYILISSAKSAWNSKQKKAIIILLIGSVIGVAVPTLLVVLLEFPLSKANIDVVTSQNIQAIPLSLGTFTIGITFLSISNNPWLLQHQKIYFLIVYSHEGITLYSKTFSKEITHHDIVILAGAFSAISSLIMDGAKTTGKVESIVLEGKQLKIINREKFICALLVEYSTQASEEAHKKFAIEFESQFQKELEHFNGEVSVFKKADEIIQKYFT